MNPKDQKDLFDFTGPEEQYGGQPPFVKGSDTSAAASRSVRHDAKHLRAACFVHIIASGDIGLTCDQVEVIMDGRHQTISARIRELVNEGRIIDSGKRRPTRSGRNANVYIATANASPELIAATPKPRKIKPWHKVTLGEVAAAFEPDGLEIKQLSNMSGFALDVDGTFKGCPTFTEALTLLGRLTLELTKP